MRLIDADAYAAEMRKRQDACRKWKSEQNKGSEMYARAEQALVTFVEAWATLEKQPTIDAIPMEWLEKKRENLILAAMVHSTVYGDNSVELCHAVNVVLDMWQKEQEAR